MAEGDAFFERHEAPGGTLVALRGDWQVANAAALDRDLAALGRGATGAPLSFDLAGIDGLDTVGAFLLLRAAHALHASLENVPRHYGAVLEHVEKAAAASDFPERPHRHFHVAEWLDHLGEQVHRIVATAADLLAFFGRIITTFGRLIVHPSHIRGVALMSQLQHNGWAALPIVGMLNFLIGVVIAYQGSGQLAQFGAQILTVNLLGISILRELGGLITAIIVAGRSGSAFTAEIGAMRVNEEIDAMRVLGIDPVEVLVMPRLIGLMISLPLLTIFANFVGIAGGSMMLWLTLDISPPVFLDQLRSALYPLTFWLGVIKSPFFAFVIVMVGCHAGLAVERSAESVGQFTTMSVVRSIFLVIVIDALFSIIFAELNV